MVLSAPQRRLLRGALAGRLLAACFGAGVDSTAMLVALKLADLRPDIITFADLRAEKPETLDHLHRMNAVLVEWGWESVTVCRKETLPGTGYADLYGNCMANETLPSLAFGLKSCSAKWKRIPQDQLIKGVKSGPNACPPHPTWIEAGRRGERIVKLIGHDCGRADIPRSRNLAVADADFDYAYPLQMLGWDRAACIRIITETLGTEMVPIKSACFFCPPSKIWELYWLAAYHPDLLERALVLERNALTGRHSRFSEVEFGASWEDFVRTADRFPSNSTTVGLGRSFDWNQWARTNGVVDGNFPRPARRRRSRPLPRARRPGPRRRQCARRPRRRVSGGPCAFGPVSKTEGNAIMSPHDAVKLAYREHRREVRFAAMLFRRMGFRLNSTRLDRLAMRVGFNGGDWHAAARREAMHILHLALCPDRTIWRGRHWREPFTLGL